MIKKRRLVIWWGIRSARVWLACGVPHYKLIGVLINFERARVRGSFETAGGNGWGWETTALLYDEGGERVWISLARRKGKERAIHSESGGRDSGRSVGTARWGSRHSGERRECGERDAPQSKYSLPIVSVIQMNCLNSCIQLRLTSPFILLSWVINALFN